MLAAHGCSWSDLEVGELLRVYGEGDSKSSGQAVESFNRVALNDLLVGTGV